MYLKSIEMQGFKSFANKMVLEFHNGITGIVGPNGSGKSNVADAVRWVLGEQSARQLRGESMQDVIFAGTENRRPLSYAYVAITLDNSDHSLPVDFNEVTVSRRVYRSGESEYLINNTPSRLKDVNELFYDTGIGKEGYSIIGQGQIEKIISGKPEDRRELFDEAVGIVKFKKRKEASEKKLASERENLIRVNDILSELEKRVGPLQKESEIAKKYLSLRDRLKKLDVNMYLFETDRLNKEIEAAGKNIDLASGEFEEEKKNFERIKEEYQKLDKEITEISDRTEKIRDEESDVNDKRAKLLNQITLLEEQIHSAENSDESLAKRKADLSKEHDEKKLEKEKAEEELLAARSSHEEAASALKKARDDYKALEDEIKESTAKIEADHKRIVEVLNEKGRLKSELQRVKTIREQSEIRKSEIAGRLIKKKTKDSSLEDSFREADEQFKKEDSRYQELIKAQAEFRKKSDEWKAKKQSAEKTRVAALSGYHQLKSSLDAVKNIAERYEGFGSAARKVMDMRDEVPGIIGVVSDLIHADEKYETAIETALGGNIQNIVTEDEATAKRMIDYLKKGRYGRATFLPLTSVHPKENPIRREFLDEAGVLGMADELISCDDRFRDVMKYLVGRVIVIDTIDHALSFARKTHYQNHVVTLEGEYLRPGGSLSGGSFKNKNNLLGRTRQIDELEKRLETEENKLHEAEKRLGDIETAEALLSDDLESNLKETEEAALSRNTASINRERAEKDLAEAKKSYESLGNEQAEIEKRLSAIDKSTIDIEDQMKSLDDEETDLNKDIEKNQDLVDEKTYMETAGTRALSEAQVEEAAALQKMEFINRNLTRINEELLKNEKTIASLDEESKNAREDSEKKKADIIKIRETIEAAEKRLSDLKEERLGAASRKEKAQEEYKGAFEKRDKSQEKIQSLDRELYRLNSKKQKLEEELDYQNNYMWDEYELTLHAALELKDPDMRDPVEMKKEQAHARNEMKAIGSVNLKAIDEYREVSERYEFLKGQHDDLCDAEQSLMKIIEDLDKGMRQQFNEGFADIRIEFDKTFKLLFGGGKGTLELVEGEDLLETGIRIIAQPPGKKLQNMMQLSGGEKSLTAIALLFAIQHLKPSPFCLLDEIEAALDDSNVDRFAHYLHRLSKNTQFIVITHRRGTMNAADRLYGITMQEKGVSTLVSVDLIEKDLDN